MSPYEPKKIPMSIWCPLIPPEDYERLKPFETDLEKIRQAYDDWLASMRGKPFVGTDIGVLLDRIRILMINIGVSCGQNRELAETFQTILSERLKKSALKIIKELPEKRTEKLIKKTLTEFFENLRFTRDIYPREEMEKAVVSIEDDDGKGSNFILRIFGRITQLFTSERDGESLTTDEIIERSLREGTNVLKRIYIRLMSPDPWGVNSH